MRKLDFPSKLKYAIEKNSGGRKSLKVAKNNDFTFFGLILLRGHEVSSEINVRVQFRVSFSFTFLQKKILF